MKILIALLPVLFFFTSCKKETFNDLKERFQDERNVESTKKSSAPTHQVQGASQSKKVSESKPVARGPKPYVVVEPIKSVVNPSEYFVARIHLKNYTSNKIPSIKVNGFGTVYDEVGKFSYFTINTPNSGKMSHTGSARIPRPGQRDTTINFTVNYTVR